jgi:hypothetical protein
MNPAATNKSNDTKPVDPRLEQSNLMAVQVYRSIVVILLGLSLGVLGLTNLAGIATFLLGYAVSSLFLLYTMDFKPEDYLRGTKVWSFLFADIGGQTMSFLFFWTLSYTLVTVY